VPRQRIPSPNWSWGPKLPQVQNLRDDFVFFFEAKIVTLEKLGAKTAINPI